MASKYIGIPAAATAVAGAVVTLYRWRSFGLIPKLLVKAPAGTVPNDQPGNLRTLTMVAALWAIDKARLAFGIWVYCVMCPSGHSLTLLTTKRIAR